MKTATIAAGLATLCGAAQAQYFSVIASRSASPIHFLTMNARGQRIYLGGETASYCPDVAAQQNACPPGNYTNFYYPSASGAMLMGANVPGGQYVSLLIFPPYFS